MVVSIINQTYKNWELIIVDDGSTDKSQEIIKEFEKQDSRIKYFQRPENRKKGGNTCRNIGFEKAQGKYVIWFDADDIIVADCIQKRVEFMEKNADLDFGVFPGIGFIDKIGNWNGRFYGFRSEKNALNNLIARNLPFIVWTNIYRIESLKNILNTAPVLWDENLTSLQDSDFNILCLNSGLRFKESECGADYFWRCSHNSVSSNMLAEKHLSNHIYLLEKTIKNFEERPEFNTHLKLTIIWTYQHLTQAPQIWTDKFFNLSYLKKKRIFATKLKLVNFLYSKVTKGHKQNTWLHLIFPYLSLQNRYIRKLFPFNSSKKQDLNDLILLTNDRIKAND